MEREDISEVVENINKLESANKSIKDAIRMVNCKADKYDTKNEFPVKYNLFQLKIINDETEIVLNRIEKMRFLLEYMHYCEEEEDEIERGEPTRT